MPTVVVFGVLLEPSHLKEVLPIYNRIMRATFFKLVVKENTWNHKFKIYVFILSVFTEKIQTIRLYVVIFRHLLIMGNY